VAVGENLGGQGWVDRGEPDLRLLPGGGGPLACPVRLVDQLLEAGPGAGQGGGGLVGGVSGVGEDATQMGELLVAKLLEFG